MAQVKFLLPFRNTVPESFVYIPSVMAHIPRHGERRTRPSGIINVGLIMRSSLEGSACDKEELSS